MKVSFTRKEYSRLLELVHMGLWAARARPDDPATMPERYAEITQKVFALAEVFGCADLVETDVNGRLYVSAKLLEGETATTIDRFIEESFWNELVDRLADRDLRNELGTKTLTPEVAAVHDHRLAVLEDSYWREFEVKGLENLVLLRGGKG
jgi:hypothetical protein